MWTPPPKKKKCPIANFGRVLAIPKAMRLYRLHTPARVHTHTCGDRECEQAAPDVV